MRLRALAATAAAFAALAHSASAGIVTVPINHTVRLPVAGPAASVVVGNPAVADVTVVDSRTVFVSGRSAGSTDVIVLDSLGRTLFASDIDVAGPNRGHVAVYRGNVRSDVACDPGCGANGLAAGGAAAPALPGSGAVSAVSAAAALPSALPDALTGKAPPTPR